MPAPGLDDLWNGARPATRRFCAEDLKAYPEAARRFLLHAIAPGALLASAVRLRMHGEIKLHRWCPFTAAQVIAWDQGLMWTAKARVRGLPISGFDRLAGGHGMMRWKLLGVVPVMSADGLDITRSGAGRMMAESMWLPSVLCRPDVSWTADDPLHPRARLTVAGESAEVSFAIDADGTLRSGSLARWSNPDNTQFRYLPFGAMVEAHRTFEGFTIPTRLRAGYFIGTPRFESEGEFFRVTIDHAAYR